MKIIRCINLNGSPCTYIYNIKTIKYIYIYTRYQFYNILKRRNIYTLKRKKKLKKKNSVEYKIKIKI